jgi:hypothetical protein
MLGLSSVNKGESPSSSPSSSQATDTLCSLSAGGSPATGGTSAGLREAPGAARTTAPAVNYARILLPWITNELLFSTVLDMGCGDGSAVADLNRASYEAHGIDLLGQPNATQRITRGDLFHVAMSDGYFDLVICAHTLQEIEDHRVPSALAEIDRLSNSYIVLSMPSGETSNNTSGRIRPPSWWCTRFADFGWRLRLLREDPATGEIVVLAEKAHSLAAKVLPLLDDALAQNPTTEPTPVTSSIVVAPTRNDAATAALAEIETALACLKRQDLEGGYRSIGILADKMARLPNLSAELVEALKRLVATMERKDIGVLTFRLERELKPMIGALAKG